MAGYVAQGGRNIAQMSKMLERAWLSNPRGRPSEKRILAVKAYELKISNSTLKWTDIANDICNCNKRPHDDYCKESIRVAVITLQKVFKKYSLPAPPLTSLLGEET
jgi:hypothetical protein